MRVSLLLYKRVRLPEEQFPPRDAAPPEAIFFRISKETAMSRCTQVAGFGVFLFVLGTILLMFASAERNSLIYWLGGPALFSEIGRASCRGRVWLAGVVCGGRE